MTDARGCNDAFPAHLPAVYPAFDLDSLGYSPEEWEFIRAAKERLAEEGIVLPPGMVLMGVEEATIHRYGKARAFDMDAAITMIKETVEWRANDRVDELMEKQQEGVARVRRMLSSSHHGYDKKGHPVYYECTGAMDAAKLVELGISPDAFVHAHVVVMENLARNGLHLASVRAGRLVLKQTVVLDLSGVTLAKLTGEAISIFRRATGIDQNHYPETMHHLFIVNAPMIFSGCWKILRAFLDPRTAEKIEILSCRESPAALKQSIDVDQLPEAYGGTCPGPCLSTPDGHSTHAQRYMDSLIAEAEAEGRGLGDEEVAEGARAQRACGCGRGRCAEEARELLSAPYVTRRAAEAEALGSHPVAWTPGVTPAITPSASMLSLADSVDSDVSVGSDGWGALWANKPRRTPPTAAAGSAEGAGAGARVLHSTPRALHTVSERLSQEIEARPVACTGGMHACMRAAEGAEGAEGAGEAAAAEGANADVTEGGLGWSRFGAGGPVTVGAAAAVCIAVAVAAASYGGGSAEQGANEGSGPESGWKSLFSPAVAASGVLVQAASKNVHDLIQALRPDPAG